MADAPPAGLRRSSPLRAFDRPPLRTFGRALVLVAPAWIAARLVVLAALAVHARLDQVSRKRDETAQALPGPGPHTA